MFGLNQPYKTPPITEAVIEVRFDELLEQREIDRANRAFKQYYFLEEILRDLNLAVSLPQETAGNPTAVVNQQIGFKRTSPDLTEITILKPTAFCMAQLAPYPGWAAFSARFKRDWGVCKKVLGYRKISRIGIRYINRIDIPANGAAVLDYENFLNIYPHFPVELGATLAYNIQAQFPLDDLGCTLTVGSASIPSPLLDHLSFLFDQDIATSKPPPQSDEGIFEFIERIRQKKNSIFELCITEQSRGLFR